MSTEFCSKHYSDTLIAGSFQALSVISSSPEQWAVEESFDCVFLIKKFAMPLTGLEYCICYFLSPYEWIFETILDMTSHIMLSHLCLDGCELSPKFAKQFGTNKMNWISSRKLLFA